MTQIANAYAQGLYDLANDEGLAKQILEELSVLQTAFQEEPMFCRLLSTPELSKEERLSVLDKSFRDQVHPYVLNFLKILTEKGYIRQFPDCCDAYRGFYNEDNGILVVKVQSAVELTDAQKQKLTAKLEATTGRTVDLQCSIDPAVLGGLRLSYDGKQVDGTVKSRLDAIGKLLKNTVL